MHLNRRVDDSKSREYANQILAVLDSNTRNMFVIPWWNDNGLTFFYGPRFFYWFIHILQGITAFGIVNIVFSWSHLWLELREYADFCIFAISPEMSFAMIYQSPSLSWIKVIILYSTSVLVSQFVPSLSACPSFCP